MGLGRATIELVEGRDYEVLRGRNYAFHSAASCPQCLYHPKSYDPSWPKVHVLRQSGRSPEYPLAFSGAPIELVVLPSPQVHFTGPPMRRFPRRKGKSHAMGSFWDDIFNFFASIVSYIVDKIEELLKKILYDLLHPLQLLKDMIQAMVDISTGKAFMDFFASFPLTRWLYLGIDHLTGGFLTNLTVMLSLPGKFVSGQPITRKELMISLGVFAIIAGTALAFFTGGATLALIGLAVTLLKAGPIGKTALGRTILDIAGIGLSAICGGGDLVETFIAAGESRLEGTAIGELANKLHISPVIVGLVRSGAGAVTGGGGDGEDGGDEGDSEVDTSDESASESDTSDSSESPSPSDTSTPAAATSDESTPAAAVSEPSDSESATPSSDESEPDTSPDTSPEESDTEEPDAETSSSEDTEASPSSDTSADASDEAAASDEEDDTTDEEDDSGDEEDTSTAEDALQAALDAAKVAQALLNATGPKNAPTSKAPASTKPAASPASLKPKALLSSKNISSIHAASAQSAGQTSAQAKKSMLMVAGLGGVVLLALLNKRGRS